MSFDLSLKYPACEYCGSDGKEVWDWNITHNVNSIVDLCIGPDVLARDKKGGGYPARSWGRLFGWPASEALLIVQRALAVANDPAREAEFRALQPSNGWGSLEGVREAFADLARACAENPKAIFEAWG